MTQEPMTYVPVQLKAGAITVLLGPDHIRRLAMSKLDDSSGRCANGDGLPIRRLSADAGVTVERRVDAVWDCDADIMLIDRLTDGLSAADRSTILGALRARAESGTTVLIDDEDPVAVLAVADQALRCGPTGVSVEEMEPLGYLAS